MCESNVYLKKGDGEKLIMENVAAVTPAEDNKILLQGVFGEKKEVGGRILDINLMAHKIIITP